MQCTTTIRSPGAIALGAFFAGVTGYVLFKDVLDGAAITTNHVLSLAALVAALASGHMALPELKAGRVFSAATLALLFLASTSYVVISSGARNAETAATKAANIAQANADRTRVEAERGKAQAMLDEERRAMARECASGAGKRCAGIKASVDVYSAAVAGHDAALAKLKPAEREGAGYAHAAQVLAAIPGLSVGPAEIEQRLKLLLPFLVVIIAELGTIAFLGIGLGHQRRPITATVSNGTVRPADPRLCNRGKRGPRRNDVVASFIAGCEAKLGRLPSGPELMARFPSVPRSTLYWYRSNVGRLAA